MAVSSSTEYCTTQDIYDIYPNISGYDTKKRLFNFEVVSGRQYRKLNSGLISQLYADGVDLGIAQNSIAAVDAEGEWYYDSGDNAVYYYAEFSPNTKVMEAGDDFEDLMQRIKRKASRLIESQLGIRISREILKDREGIYPSSIIHLTALKSIIMLIKAHNPTSADLSPLTAEYDEIIDKILLGRIVMPGKRTKDNRKGLLRKILADTIISYEDEVLPVELKGYYQNNDYELLKVVIKGQLLSPFLDKNGNTTDGICSVNPTSLSSDEDTLLYSESECTTNGYTWLTERSNNPLELYYSVWGKSATTLKATQLIKDKLITGDYQDLGVSNMQIRWGFTHWENGYGDVTTTGAVKLVEGVNGTFRANSVDKIYYTGPDGAGVNALLTAGDLPNITGIQGLSAAATLISGTFYGALSTLTQGDAYTVIASADQTEISYNNGLSIWNGLIGSEYEIELKG